VFNDGELSWGHRHVLVSDADTLAIIGQAGGAAGQRVQARTWRLFAAS